LLSWPKIVLAYLPHYHGHVLVCHRAFFLVVMINHSFKLDAIAPKWGDFRFVKRTVICQVIANLNYCKRPMGTRFVTQKAAAIFSSCRLREFLELSGKSDSVRSNTILCSIKKIISRNFIHLFS